MTDAELNIALHDLLPREDRRAGYVIAHDYCHDSAWAWAMEKKYHFDIEWIAHGFNSPEVCVITYLVETIDNCPFEYKVEDLCPIRTVALAVLALLQQKDGE